MKISKQAVLYLLAGQKKTMKSLAEDIGMMPQNLSLILNRGSCNPVTAGKIADGLGVHLSEIIKEES